MTWPKELESHSVWMRKIVHARLGDGHAVDDVLQEILLSLLETNGRPQQPEKLRSWLYQIVVRRTADYLRKKYRQQRLIDRYASDQPRSEPENDGWEWVIAAEQRSLLRQALGDLDQTDRELILLKYGDDWTYQRLANKFAVSERVIEYRLVRVKKTLRTKMWRILEGENDG